MPSSANPTHCDEPVDTAQEVAVDEEDPPKTGSPGDAEELDPTDADGTRGQRLRESGAALLESGAALREASAEAIRERSGAALRKVEDAAPASVAARIRAFRERIRHRRALDTAWRVSVFALGVTLLILGLIMFVVPGPGFATIILALVILGSEFAWATRVLDPVKAAAQRAAKAATDPRRRRRNLTLAAILGVVAGVVLAWYLVRYGLTLQPIWAMLTELRSSVTGFFG